MNRVPYYYKNASLLFVGINPHPWSARRQVPFSNNKSFRYHLADAWLIDATRAQLKNDEFLQELYWKRFESEFGLGLINMIDRPSVSIADLKSWEEQEGRARLSKIIKKHHPAIVCFVGKSPYEKYSSIKSPDYGRQEPIGSSQVYVKHDPLRGYTHIRIQELQDIQARRELLLAQTPLQHH